MTELAASTAHPLGPPMSVALGGFLDDLLADASHPRLSESLKTLAGTVVSSGVLGRVVITVVDEEECLTTVVHARAGSSPETLAPGGFEAELPQLSALEPAAGWQPLPGKVLGSSRCVARALSPPDHSRGIVIAFEDTARLEETELAFLGTAVKAAIRAEECRYLVTMEELLARGLESGDGPESSTWCLRRLVEALKDHFHATAASIFLAVETELHLAASTDRDLLASESRITYLTGEGLTGWIAEAKRPLRLRDGSDPREIHEVTGMERRGPRFPEHDDEGAEIHGPFLGVPMLAANEVLGVIRLSRRDPNERFTRQDQKALSFLASTLGAQIACSQWRRLAEGLLEALGDAVAVSLPQRTNDGEERKVRVVKTNRATETLLGRSREEIHGLEAAEFFAPGELEKIRKPLLQAIAQAQEQKKGHSTLGPRRSVFRDGNGNDKPVQLSYSLVSHKLLQKPVVYTIAIARDLSASEEEAGKYKRLLSLLDAMDIAYLKTDKDGHTLETTTADTRITGYSDTELREMLREELYVNPPKRRELLAIARGQGGKVSGHLVQLRRKDGQIIWTEGDLRIVKDAEGREIGIESLYRDVTQRMLLQRLLGEDQPTLWPDDKLYRRLKEEAELQLDYQSSLGHQIETPLSALVGTLENLRDGILDREQLRRRLKWIMGQVRVCARMTKNLSFLDRVLRGEPPSIQPMAWRKLAFEAAADFEHLVEEKELELSVDEVALDKYLPDRGDPDLLRQVLVNLLDNAIKYSRPGSTIRIGATRRSEGRIFQISNQGIPIPPEERERIFERRYRTKMAENLVPHSTGLGLWLVRKIVESHEATVRCLEVAEDGEPRTAFRVIFPNPPAEGEGHER